MAGLVETWSGLTGIDGGQGIIEIWLLGPLGFIVTGGGQLKAEVRTNVVGTLDI